PLIKQSGPQLGGHGGHPPSLRDLLGGYEKSGLVTLATGATVRVRELIKDAMLQPAHQYPELLNTRFG
ncbi:MAG: hypothetical protein AWU57_1524, partial [Marinobacter sp. T13-3]